MPQLAERDDRVAVFSRSYSDPRYQRQILDLARHAAFPLTLTTDLIYCLHQRFTPDIPWYAAPDLLLSVLCDPVGHDLYEMQGITRLHLLHQLVEAQGEQRLDDLSTFMTDYISYRLNLEPTERARVLGDRPQWTALACLKPSEAVEQIQQALKAVAEQDNAREHIRLAAIVRNYANLIDPLERLDYRPLLVQWAKQATQNAIEIDGLVLHPFEYQVATLHPADEPPPPEGLTPFRFTVVSLDRRGKEAERKSRRAYQFVEDLPGGVGIEMVAIPSGRFLMGSPEGEGGDSERPQHQVTVPPFFMGRYPITQAQWRAVAAMPKVKQDLETDPSHFKGDDMRPVEQVSWDDAMEFCARLSAHTGRSYSLPSEAEWEYACRAGTTTPFHFGETITTDVANYDGNYTYGDGPKGERRGKTTPVGQFGVANAFGLCDMHGNVREWCLDSWHGNYEGAPTDGSAWDADGARDGRVRRGGSWDAYPTYCRSAYRNFNFPANRLINGGFRVVCHVRGTP